MHSDYSRMHILGVLALLNVTYNEQILTIF
jgi:hypothetical protein